MKGFVVLAIVLLVPTLAYFQKQYFESNLQPRLRASVTETLQAEGVEAPSVRLEYLDAIISGQVESEARREEVAAKVDGLPGVRIGPEGNLLKYYGWIRIAREGGAFHAEGLMPGNFEFRLPPEIEVQDGWDERVQRGKTVLAPEGTESWGEFLEEYFEEGGNRNVELRQGGVAMRGDATVLLRGDWRAKASDVVDRSQVADEFTLHPSLLHFPGYRPRSMADAEGYETLRESLASATVELHAEPAEDEEVPVPASERDKVVRAARAILGAGDEVRYVVGGHPKSEGNATRNGHLAKRRAEAVVKLLMEEGIPAAQLEVVSFGVTPGGARDNQVEILVK